MQFRLPCLLLWWFLIQFLFRTDAKCSSANLASSCGGFLFNSCSKLMQNVLLATLLPPEVVSHLIPIQNLCKMLFFQPCILLLSFLVQFIFKTDAKCSFGCLASWWFLIQFLFRTDAKCSSGNLASSRGGFSFNTDSKLMQNALLSTLHPPVVVSYSILIQN